MIPQPLFLRPPPLAVRLSHPAAWAAAHARRARTTMFRSASGHDGKARK
jgi:hypothetical protein